MYSQIGLLILTCCLIGLACGEQQNTTRLSTLDNLQRDAGLTLGDQVSAGMESIPADYAPTNEDAVEEESKEISDDSTEMNIGSQGDLQSMTGTEDGNMTGTEESNMDGAEDSSIAESETDQPNQDYGDTEDSSVLCGDQSCDLTTNTCCLREFGASCVEGANTTCNLGGTPLICDGPEDCNGDQCCLGVGLPGELTCSPNTCVNLTICHTEQDCAEDKICRRCQFIGVELAVCSRPNVIPNLALSCE